MEEGALPSKESLRKAGLKVRGDLDAATRKKKSEEIARQFFSMKEARGAETIAFYISCKDEVETEAMIKRAIEMGKRVAAPVARVGERRLDMVYLYDFEEGVKEGAYGILEPIEGSGPTLKAEEIDVIIVPALAFDRTGARLGYGCGYYDRFLKRLKDEAVKIGLAFEVQMVDEVPFESHDERVDYIVTETGIIGSFGDQP